MGTKAEIEAKLTEAFQPSLLQVTDQSHLHQGHAEAGTAGESHFHVEIISANFDGKSRPERHRMVYQALEDQLAGGVHALAISASTPGEK